MNATTRAVLAGELDLIQVRWAKRRGPHDRWKFLIACMFLNMTTRHVAEPVLLEFFRRWSTPTKIMNANQLEIEELVRPLGLQHRRTNAIVKMSCQWVSNKAHRRDPKNLFGIGTYAMDAWNILVKGNLDIDPTDKALAAYVTRARIKPSGLVSAISV